MSVWGLIEMSSANSEIASGIESASLEMPIETEAVPLS